MMPSSGLPTLSRSGSSLFCLLRTPSLLSLPRPKLSPLIRLDFGGAGRDLRRFSMGCASRGEDRWRAATRVWLATGVLWMLFRLTC